MILTVMEPVEVGKRPHKRSASSMQISRGWVKGWVTVTGIARTSVSSLRDSNVDDVEPHDNGMYP